MIETKEKQGAILSRVEARSAKKAHGHHVLSLLACGIAGCFVMVAGVLFMLRPGANAALEDGAAVGSLEIIDPDAAEAEKATEPTDGESVGVEAVSVATGQVTLVVNGKSVVSLPCKEDAEALVNAALSAGTVENGKAQFVDKVEIITYDNTTSVLGLDEAKVLVDSQSPLKVKCTVTKTEDIPVAFQTVKQNSSALYVGSTKTSTKGENGVNRKTTVIAYLDGKEVSRQEGKTEVIKKPVNQVVLVGTKKKVTNTATKDNNKNNNKNNNNKNNNNKNNNNKTDNKTNTVQGTPSFAWPTSGRISSRYGQRDGRLHAGIDISKPVGSTVKASAGGTVTRAGNAGTYGILVEIKHGNGWVTRYAHNSKVLVRAGDKVTKGQAIALSGNTGRSTGPHVHFEIRYNGSAKNPLSYLP